MTTRRRVLQVLSIVACATPFPAGAVRAPGPLEVHRPARILARDVPTRIPGGVRDDRVRSFDLPGAPRDRDAVVRALRRHLATHRERLGGVAPDALVERWVAETPAGEGLPGSVHVELGQEHEGLVVEGSRVAFTVRLLPGRSVAFTTGVALYPDLGLGAPGALGSLALRDGGARALQLRDAKLVHESRTIRFVEGRWRRVRQMRFEGEPLTAVVDEDSGESWAEDRRLFVDVGGRVTGRGKAGDPTAPGFATFALTDLEVRIPRTGSSTHTSGSGTFLFTGRPQPETVEARLSGRWIRVESVPGVENRADLVATGTGSTGLSLVFNENVSREPCAVEADTAQVNAYVHGTRIHDWIQSHVPGGVPGIDCRLHVEVNDVGNIAFYLDADHDGVCDASSYLQFGEGGLCDADGPQQQPFQNTAYDTIIYHEYGHFADDMAGGLADLGLSEGWGDLIATYASGQPLIGENFGIPSQYPECGTECIRRADNHYRFDPGDSQHVRGMAWAGFGWKLRTRLGASLAERLVFAALTGNAPDIPWAVALATLEDDDDGSLQNGTPHLAAICQAASAHGLARYVPATCGC